VNGRPTRIEMPEEGKNTLYFQNHKKQMKMPFMVYADFEALVRKIPGCKHGPERESKKATQKTERHEACGYSYMVVRSDGEVSGSKVYRGANAVGTFLSNTLQEEEKIRESLAVPKQIDMMAEDWEKFKNANDCHICNKSLIKDEFLDSIPVCDHNTGSYCGQSQRLLLLGTQKNKICWAKKRKKRKRQNRQMD